MKRSDLKKTALAAGIGVLVLVGATAAFLTSSDVAYNLFTVAKVDLDVEEEFDKDQTLAAGQIITKMPWIHKAVENGDIDKDELIRQIREKGFDVIE